MTEPSALSSEARALLDGLKRSRTPEHDGAAVLANVRLAGGAANGGPPTPTAGSTSALRIVGVVGIAALVGALGLTALDRGPSPASSATPVRAAHGDAIPPTSASAPEEPPQTLPAPARDDPSANVAAPAPAPTVESRKAATRLGTQQAANEPRDHKPTREPERPDPLLEELRLLEEARVGLAEGNLSATRAALREHARRFPNGKLAAERRAVVVELDCSARTDGFRARAEAYLRENPRSPYSQRINSKCVETKTRGRGQEGQHATTVP